MIKTLEIDFYKNGFDFKHVDCIQGPVAAAAGHYSKDFYYYYCYLHSIYGNMVNYFQEDFLAAYTNKILSELSLKLEKVDLSNLTLDEVVERIIDEIKANRPVIMVVKYNSLFYNSFYKNRGFTLNHGIIINEFNEDNRTFGIKEATLLRDYIDDHENRDVFFSLHITFDMLKDIWEESNNQFLDEKLTYANSIYSMYQLEDKSLDTNKIIIASLNMLNNFKNDFINMVNSHKADRGFNTFIVSNTLRFSGSLKPIFHLLYEQCRLNNLDRAIVEGVEETVKAARDKAINVLNKASIRGETISPERKADLCKLLKETDEELIRLIRSLVVNEKKKSLTNFFVDIKEYYNNQTFEDTLADDSVANMCGEGTHYIFQDVVINEPWKKGDFCFIYSYSPGQFDNLSCNGQSIIIPDIYATHLCILGISEYGNNNENIIVEYSDGRSEAIMTDFSDFSAPPIFGETIYWTGSSGVRREGKARYHDFNARLFAKKYVIEPGRVVRLTLPKVRNIHIFAITLTEEKFLE